MVNLSQLVSRALVRRPLSVSVKAVSGRLRRGRRERPKGPFSRMLSFVRLCSSTRPSRAGAIPWTVNGCHALRFQSPCRTIPPPKKKRLDLWRGQGGDGDGAASRKVDLRKPEFQPGKVGFIAYRSGRPPHRGPAPLRRGPMVRPSGNSLGLPVMVGQSLTNGQAWPLVRVTNSHDHHGTSPAVFRTGLRKPWGRLEWRTISTGTLGRRWQGCQQ